MEPWFKDHFGNASSSSHQWGWAAQNATEKARDLVAGLLHCNSKEITFTSGATEANNWVLWSLAEEFLILRKEKFHVISTNIEHPAIEEALKRIENWGGEVTRIACDAQGIISLQDIEAAIRPHTRLISIIWVQNEIGTIQDIQAIGELAKKKQILFHTDATQGIGKLPLNLQEVPVDMLSASAHKFYGPKGIGFLFHRQKNPKVKLLPLFVGGGQESSWRSGTINTPLIVGLGKAAELASLEILDDVRQASYLQKNFLALLLKSGIEFKVHGDIDKRSPYNLNLEFPAIKMNELQVYLPRLGVSQGSACHSDQSFFSPILKALGCSEIEATRSLRFSWGRKSSLQDLKTAVEIISKCT